MNFKPGQKVVCVDDKQRFPDRPLGALKEGEIYTIKECKGINTKLIEISPVRTEFYFSDRFRPVDDDDDFGNFYENEKKEEIVEETSDENELVEKKICHN